MKSKTALNIGRVPLYIFIAIVLIVNFTYIISSDTVFLNFIGFLITISPIIWFFIWYRVYKRIQSKEDIPNYYNGT